MKKLYMSIFVLVAVFVIVSPQLIKAGPTNIVLCGENKFIDPLNNYNTMVRFAVYGSSRTSAVFDVCQGEIPLPVLQSTLDAYVSDFELSTDDGITRTIYALNSSHVVSSNITTGEKRWRITVSGLDPNISYEPSVKSTWTVLRGGFWNRGFGDKFKLSDYFSETPNQTDTGISSSSGEGRKRFIPGHFEEYVAELQKSSLATNSNTEVSSNNGSLMTKKTTTEKVREYDPVLGYLDESLKGGTAVSSKRFKDEQLDILENIVVENKIDKNNNDSENDASKLTADASKAAGNASFFRCFWWWIPFVILAFIVGRYTNRKNEEAKKAKK